MESERIIVESPLSYLGSGRRIWRLTDRDSAAVRWLVAIPVAVALVALAWLVVTGWYLLFGLLVVPWRLLVGRRRRTRRLEDARHREQVQASQSHRT